MKKSVEALDEHGVFRPLEPVDWPEYQRVQVNVADEEEWLDRDYMEWAATQVREDVSLEAVRQALSKIPGSLTADVIAEREDR
jgi:predicted DNA-binding antitoxin AbrB/MazE fold protein